MSEDQDVLNELGTLTRKRRPGQDLEAAASAYSHAMVHMSPTMFRFQSLFHADGDTARELDCPRDNPNALVVIKGQPYQGMDACDRCQSNLKCALDGTTHTFKLIHKVNVAELMSSLEDDLT